MALFARLGPEGVLVIASRQHYNDENCNCYSDLFWLIHQFGFAQAAQEEAKHKQEEKEFYHALKDVPTLHAA